MNGSGEWGWRRTETPSLWRAGPQWLKPFTVAIPWITVGAALLMLHLLGGTLTAAEGVLFDLPDSGLSEGDTTSLVALVTPMKNETLVFFDDARYSLNDSMSAAAFGEQLSDCAARADRKTLLVLADRRTTAADLMKIAALARMNGILRILFANRRSEIADE